MQRYEVQNGRLQKNHYTLITAYCSQFTIHLFLILTIQKKFVSLHFVPYNKIISICLIPL